jgi:hypothetical protein
MVAFTSFSVPQGAYEKDSLLYCSRKTAVKTAFGVLVFSAVATQNKSN